MTSAISSERKAHIIRDDAEAIVIAQQLSAEFTREAAERDRERRLPHAELEKLSESGLLGITVPKEYGGAYVSTESSAVAASIAVAEAKALADEASIFITNKFFEISGTSSTLEKYNYNRHWRNARTHTLHDPVRWKYIGIGNYYLNGVNPPRHGAF